MLSCKFALETLLKRSSRSHFVAAIGAVAASGTLAHESEGSASENPHHETSPCSEVTARASPLFPPPTITSCEFRRGTNFARLARSRTIRRLEDTSTKATLRSRYNVQWKKPLGEGGFGAVYLATDKRTNEPVAVKQIAKSFTDDSSFQREMNAFLHIRDSGGHPNICGLRENFDEGEYYYLVLDLVAGGEVFDYLIQNGAYSEADAARLFREVGSALAFLHGINLVHGDLKPENLMLSSKNTQDAVSQLVDFGCAQIIDQSSPFYEKSTHIAATTPGYSPPEMVDRKLKLTHLEPSMDMFALGVILYVMLCGVHPFDVEGTASDDELNRRVLARQLPPLKNSPFTAHLSPSAVDLMEKLMQPNPKKRLTAHELLEHPWVRGETAKTGKIKGSDERLSKYRKYKSKLEAKVFQSMVQLSGVHTSDITKKASLIERSFRSLDPDNKGYITTKELKLLDPDTTKSDPNDDDSQLSLSGFSDLLSDHMKNRYFPSGHVIYREGDKGKNMYFINSGRVEVSTKEGFSTIVEQGDFFGEGALLSKSGKRSASVRSITPVHAIEISKEYFEKYLADGGYDTQLSLVERDKTRKRIRAKTILASTKNMDEQIFSKGSYIYKQGEHGREVYILESGEADVMIDDHVVYTLKPGELCGEHTAIFSKPRNTSAKCVSDKCFVHILKTEDFYKIVKDSATLKESLRDIAHRREFQKALVYTTRKSFPKTETELREAFDAADYNRSGKIDLSDITMMLKQMDSTFTSKEIKDILGSLDLDGSGSVDWEKFKQVFGMANKH